MKQERSNPRSKRSRECPLRYSELISCKVRARPHSLSDYINSERLRASFVWTRDGDLITVSYATLASAGRRDGGAQARENNTSLKWRTAPASRLAVTALIRTTYLTPSLPQPVHFPG